MISRMHEEVKCSEWIESQLHKNGSEIYKSWELPFGEDYDKYFEDYPYMDAANLVKVGLDILFLISPMGGSYLGFKNFKKFIDSKFEAKVRVHHMPNMYNGTHIDSTLSLIGYNKKVNKLVAVICGVITNPTGVPALLRGDNWALL